MTGTVRIYDLIDADASSSRYCGHSIGRAIEIDRGWLHVRRIERSGGAVYGVGQIVSQIQAVKLQQKWDIRWGLRVAPTAPAPDKAPGPVRLAKFGDVDAAAAAIVSAGYQVLAKRHHPDVGGTHAAMSLLTQAKTQLAKILDLAKGSSL